MTDFRSLIPFGRTGMFRSGFDPFADLRKEMDRLTDDFGKGWLTSGNGDSRGFLLPRVDIAETDKGLELTAELPGFDEKDVSLDVHDGILTIKAEHKEEREEKDEKKHYHLVERSRGSFLRRVALPFEADADKASAQLEKGLLKVVVPRLATEASKPRQIPIGPK
ncbi:MULTISPECIES: Hsp20/alpha crystallin family protein [Sphingobium]|uniref:Molecular chaperone n=1 Tax=Sphingobium baderi LL03 TaxID=1114964 RepID=T0GQ96_9SPHN|nr:MULTISPECIES: Hsp20 family protein [Sphingobium]AMK26257.1 molecular chaperone (small heat shock protein) [Sphingobium sp. TKS]EQB02168.1 molecular chaperone [Sphingobium baderi LL03]KMS59008.1 molecular chaperone [Sphingobium baderi LL03]